jgi:hypothetical protein
MNLNLTKGKLVSFVMVPYVNQDLNYDMVMNHQKEFFIELGK